MSSNLSLPLFSPPLLLFEGPAEIIAGDNPREHRPPIGRPWSGPFAVQNSNSIPGISRPLLPTRGRVPTSHRPRRQSRYLPSSPRSTQLPSPRSYYLQDSQQPHHMSTPLTPSRFGPNPNAGGVTMPPGVVTTTSVDFVVVGNNANSHNSGGLLQGHQHRRLRLPSLGRRPRSSSCDIITSPGILGVYGTGSPVNSTPKSSRGVRVREQRTFGGGPSWNTPVRARTRSNTFQFNYNKGWSAPRMTQVRTTSWDDGDDYVGSGSSTATSRLEKKTNRRKPQRILSSYMHDWKHFIWLR